MWQGVYELKLLFQMTNKLISYSEQEGRSIRKIPYHRRITSPEPIIPFLKFQDHFSTHPSLKASSESNRGSQCHSTLHTCAQIEISPLTLPVHQTQPRVKVSKALSWLLQLVLRANRRRTGRKFAKWRQGGGEEE